MEKRTTILVSTLFILVIVGMFAFTYLKNQEQAATSSPESEPAEDMNADANTNYNVSSISAKRFYEDGTHTLVGAITLPTPCDLLEVEAQVMEAAPEQVRFDFTVLNTAEVCTQVVTDQRFMVSAEANEMADLQATFMGEPVELNIVEAEPGESPEDFELFIKG